MKRHLLLVYWLVMLVSTLAIGVVAFRLLDHERERVTELAGATARAHGQTIADNLDLLVTDAKAGLMDGLGNFTDEGLETQMFMWKIGNPYARAIFVYRPSIGLTLPGSQPAERGQLEPWLRTADGWVWGPGPADGTVASGPMLAASRIPQNSGAPGENPPAQTPAINNYNQLKDDRAVVRGLTKNGIGPLALNSDNNARDSRGGAGTTGQSPNAASLNGLVTASAGFISSSNGQVFFQSQVRTLPEGGSQMAVRLTADGTGVNTSIVIAPLPPPGTLANPPPPEDRGLVTNGPPALPQIAAASPNTRSVTAASKLQSDNPNAADLVALSDAAQNLATPAVPDQAWVLAGPTTAGASADTPRWVGWFRPATSKIVRGVEMSWVALARHLRSAFPATLEPGEGFVLLDAAGNAVLTRFANDQYRFGQFDTPKPAPNAPHPPGAPLAVLPVGDEMPGWSLAVYLDPTVSFSATFVLVSTILVGILIISMLAGGTLLLWQARREASDAARKTNFVSNVSHELKTPLTSIRMYAEMLGEGRVRDATKQRSYLATIVSESQRLARLVNNVLDFSRLEQGHKKYAAAPVALAPLVAEALERQRPRLDEAGFSLETNFAEDDTTLVLGDRDALEQVLLNLVDNAMKYAAEGRWLAVRLRRDDAVAELIVEDRGPGVPPAHRERIFEMFHRVDDNLTASQPGCGLGLSIARRLLRDQGGDLRYEPNVPRGARFVATIPLAERPAPTARVPVTTV